MPSIVPGFEYDVFVSYRQKDNRYDGWVSEFVNNLRRELEATFKEDISIYFDSNPYDGLLENHDVDKSLEGKLKCLVFIPIVSQTYCDPNSYAWQREFCAFNRLSQEDAFGRDVRLGTGNVASRILPITIHDLDVADRRLIEESLNTKFRCVEFIFRSPGVNRALRPDDRRDDNLSHLLYRDQINKVANALKEIINGIRFPTPAYTGIRFTDEDSEYFSDPAQPGHANGKQGNSIAVLPFVSLASDSSQEYFADGITENILIQLASIPQLRVISRTSVMRYKKTTKSAPEIASELGVKYILEGSAQSHANRVRINVQLIDAEKDMHLWSKVFVESMDDIFTIQDKVSDVVSAELQSSMSPRNRAPSKAAPTKDLEAYDLFLKGRHAFNQWNVEGYRVASDYFRKALERDPEFRLAYSYLASSYSARMSWNGDLGPAEALPFINQYLDEAWKRGATDNDYLTKAFVEFFINKDFDASESMLLKAAELGPNNATVLYTYSYVLCLSGRLDEAREIIQKARLIEPHSVAYFNYQGIYLYLRQEHEAAAALFKEGLKLFPQVIRFSDHLGRLYLTRGQYKEAKNALSAGLRSSEVRPASMVAHLAIAYLNLDMAEKSEELLTELIQRSDSGEKGVNVYVAHYYAARREFESALAWIEKSRQTNDIGLIWFDVDPLLSEIRQYMNNPEAVAADFTGAEKFIVGKLEAELPKNLPYHNLDHSYDVMESALRIAEFEKIGDQERRLLRLAALYHDSGFISTYKNHEEKGCLLAQETLPAFGITPGHIEAICSMIMATKIPQSPQNNLDKILCDADLDYLGRDDFYDVGERLFKEMKNHGHVETEREWNLIQRVFLENHRYNTAFSKANRETRKQQHLVEIIAKLRR